jgi:predicted 3-demethylubiquinone-9 3-methyltransferase (glyoxalase superfamily)
VYKRGAFLLVLEVLYAFRINSLLILRTRNVFNDNAEEAAQFYVSVFPKAKLGAILRAPEGGPTKAGSVLTVTFTIDNIEFVALNGGPHQPFTDAISLVVPCDSQAEIDETWDKLLAGGGQEVACGWLRDKFGVSWQVVPANIGKLIQGRDAEGGKRAMQAMLQMKKLDIEVLKRAGGFA